MDITLSTRTKPSGHLSGGEQENDVLHASEDDIKEGWFRPSGATPEITDQRLDGDAPALEAKSSCCYPTRFQASGLYFPTEECWEVNAWVRDKELTFVVWVESQSK